MTESRWPLVLRSCLRTSGPVHLVVLAMAGGLGLCELAPAVQAEDPPAKPAANAQREAEPKAAEAKKSPEKIAADNRKLQRKLQARTDLKVEKLALTDVVKKLAELHDITIRLDEAALKKANVSVDAPITASVENFTLSSTLKHILKDLKLQFGIVEGELVIGDALPAAEVEAKAKVAAVAAEALVVDVAEAAVVAGVMLQGGDAVGQQFQRHHKSLLQAELNLVQAVCQPTPEQMQQIRASVEKQAQGKLGGKPKAAGDAAQNVEGQKRAVLRQPVAVAQANPGDPLKLTRDWVAKAVKEHLSEDQAATYAREVAQRQADRREASIHAIVARFDRDLILSTQQREQITAKLTDNWNESWATSHLHILNADNWFPNIPEPYVVEFLTPEQKIIWKQNRSQNRNLNFGVQQFAGFMNGMFGEEFLMQDEAQPGKPAEAAGNEGPQE
ncbi:MAG: hypothetical protein JSS02_12080 [Planctomycetes bacterium]|nr:hypothetical protein [Planctomycetota bacterium]